MPRSLNWWIDTWISSIPPPGASSVTRNSKTLAMTTMQKTWVAATVAAAVGTGISSLARTAPRAALTLGDSRKRRQNNFSAPSPSRVQVSYRCKWPMPISPSAPTTTALLPKPDENIRESLGISAVFSLRQDAALHGRRRRPPLQRLRRDVAAEMRAVKFDSFNRRIRRTTRSGQIFRPSSDAQHASAVGHDLLARPRRARVENLDA